MHVINCTRWKWGAMAACLLTLGSAVAHHVKDEVALTADVLFDFDTAKPPELIVLIGHADRLESMEDK
jgi:hypothetical protein